MMQRLKQYYWLGPWLLFVAAFTTARWLQASSGPQLWWSINLWAALSFLVAWLSFQAIRMYPTEAGLFAYALFIGIAAGVMLCAVTYLWPQQPTLRSNDYTWQALLLLYTCWTSLHSALVRKNKRLAAALQQQQSAASLHREAALYKLRQQLQPHFLYNSLNSINALIALSPAEAQKMVVKLSDFLRSAVKQEGAERIPLAEELAYIQNYLDIELIRFGHRLQVQIEDRTAPEAALSLPPFLLQPLLENAIKYGLYGVTEAVTIRVAIFEEDSLLVCQISNPYSKEQNPVSGTGFGLYGLQQRLQLLFARADLLQLTRTDRYFTATLKIPQSPAPVATQGEKIPT